MADGSKSDVPELVEILKRLARHRDALYESGYTPIGIRNRVSELHGQFLEALEEDDPETAWRFLDTMVREAGVQITDESRHEMRTKLLAVMDARLANADRTFDAGYADFGPEAAKMCDIMNQLAEEPGSKADRDAYWRHPLPWLCEQLELRVDRSIPEEIDRDDLEKAAHRLNSIIGLRGMDPLPGPNGGVADEAQPDLRWMFGWFKELDRDGTTAKLWRTLIGNHGDVLVEAGLWNGNGNVHDSPWVPAKSLWRERFDNIKEVTRFRQDHPEMFRNPSQYRLEIHAALWATHWAGQDNAGFESLGGDPDSIADDPNAQDGFLEGAARRMQQLRAKKQAKEAAKKQ
jgi:hypothetical protein